MFAAEKRGSREKSLNGPRVVCVYSFVLARQRAEWKAKKYIRRVCREGDLSAIAALLFSGH